MTVTKASHLSLARMYVKQWAPYFGPTLYGMIPVPVPDLTKLAGGPLAVTDRLVLLYEPEWVESNPVQVVATGLGHECMHDLLRHVARGKHYPHKQKFNIAGDLFINGSMAAQRVRKTIKGHSQEVPLWEFPQWAAMPEKFGLKAGLTADEYYALLPDPPECSGGSFMCGSCGGIAGNPTKHELESKMNKEHGRTEAECKIIVRETARSMQEFLSKGQGRGSMRGFLDELVEISESVFAVPWRTKVATLLRSHIGNMRAGGMDYSMRRPSKRSYLRGITLPSLISYDPTLFIIVDSSGSMMNQQLRDALRVSSDIMTQTGIQSAYFMEADVGKQRDPIRVTPHALRAITINGRGGTDFRPAIEFAEKFKPRPNIIMYVTDGDGAAPAEKPVGINFIWCIVPSPWSRRPAKWGDLVWLSDTVIPEAPDDEEDEDTGT